MRAALLAFVVAGAFLVPSVTLTTTAAQEDTGEIRAIWVDSFNPGLRSPEEIDALIERARRGNLNTIVAQVRRNAQGLYALSPEGWMENYVPPPGFDPLADLVAKAHANDIEVHAWVNIGAIYSGHPLVPTASFPCAVPCDPGHLFNQHGWGSSGDEYWLTKTHPSYTAGTHAAFPGERMSNGVWFLDLGHPKAAEHTVGVLVDLVRDYGVDGLHLDYIRYPEMPITRPPAGGLSFSIGYNPVSVRRFNAAFARPAGSLPDPWDASWSQWRRDQVSAFVRRLYLEMLRERPDAKLSAALITFFRGPNASEPRTFQQTEAYYRVFQDWQGWMREGVLDVSMPMIYKSQHLASHVTQFNEWSAFTKDAQYDRHGALGLGSYMNSLENTLVQVDLGRAPSAAGARSRGINFFSYHATNATAATLPPLRPQDEFFRAIAEDGAYAPQAPFSEPTSVPVMTWKAFPSVGHLLAQVVGPGGEPADGARVRVRKLGTAATILEQHADGNGYVGAVDLEPGAYQLLVELPGQSGQWTTVPSPVVPGRVTAFTVALGRRPAGPMVRPAMRADRPLPAVAAGEPEASPLDAWQTREPLPEDIAIERGLVPQP